MRSCFRSLLVLAAGLAVIAAADAAEPTAKERIRILLTYGGHGFEQQPFFAMFDALPGIHYTKAEMPKSAGLLKPGLEKQYDVIVMYDMTGKISPKQQEDFLALLRQGIGLVTLHHNLGAHRDWDEYRKIIGGKYLFGSSTLDGKKYPPSTYAHGQDLKVSVADRQHPITEGLKDFAIHDETYGKFYVAPDAQVLLTTDHPKNNPQIAWVKQYGKSRVFYFMLGHDSKAWTNPAYPEIVARGIRWAAGR